MSWMGSVISEIIRNDASSSNIPGSASNSVEIDSALAKEAASILIQSNVASPFYITLGPAGSEENLILVEGYASTVVTIPRMPIHISKGVRLGLRAFGAGAITSGIVTINLWS